MPTHAAARPQARGVVSGRLVNAYSLNDWVLAVIFRAHSRNALVRRPAGNAPIDVVSGLVRWAVAQRWRGAGAPAYFV